MYQRGKALKYKYKIYDLTETIMLNKTYYAIKRKENKKIVDGTRDGEQPSRERRANKKGYWWHKIDTNGKTL